MRTLKTLFLLASLSLSFATLATAKPGPLVVVLLPGTSLNEWRSADAPNLKRLMATGALAVMNTRTARLPTDRQRETPESATLTLGAGARAAGGAGTTSFLSSPALVPEVGVRAGRLYERRMGRKAPGDAALDLSWPALVRTNQGQGHDIYLGALSETLARHGIPIRAGGGAFSRLVAVSGDGTVFPASSVDQAGSRSVLIWDAGENMGIADRIIADAVRVTVSRHGELIVLSPFVNDQDYASGRRLAPVLVCGEGVPSGLLASPSTRRPGLVTNTDFAPSVAAYFQLDKTAFAVRPFGDAWQPQPATDALGKVSQLEEGAYRQGRGMQILPYLAVALTIWLLLGTWLPLMGLMSDIWPLVPLAVILALLVSCTVIAVSACTFGSLLIFFLLGRRFGNKAAITLALALTVVLLLMDMVTGSHLMQTNLLGYSAVEGARYYGIGNEAMGVFIGAILVLVSRWWPAKRLARIGTVALLAVLSLLLSSPQAGAKAGGLLVSIAGFGTLVYGLWRSRWSAGVVMGLLLLTVGALAAVALEDAFLAHSQHSHLGEAVRRIQSGGIGEAGDIIARKLAVESRLAYHSAWAYLLWIGLICLGIFWRRSREAAKVPEDNALRTAGIVAIAACLAFNDAGIVAAALCMIPLWVDTAVRSRTDHTEKAPGNRASRGLA